MTGEHPFWTSEAGWLAAQDLVPGTEILTSVGGWVRVGGGTWLARRETVYNLEVDQFHTYFVGDSGAWVHNTCAARPTSVTIGRPVQARIGNKKVYLRVDVERVFNKLEIQGGKGKNKIQVPLDPDRDLAPQIERAFPRLAQSVRDILTRSAEQGRRVLRE